MKHTMVDTSSLTGVYSPTSSAQVMTFPKLDLISSEALCLCQTAIIINLKKNPTSLSNHHHHQPFLKTHLWNFEWSKNLYCRNFQCSINLCSRNFECRRNSNCRNFQCSRNFSRQKFSATFKISEMGFEKWLMMMVVWEKSGIFL